MCVCVCVCVCVCTYTRVNVCEQCMNICMRISTLQKCLLIIITRYTGVSSARGRLSMFLWCGWNTAAVIRTSADTDVLEYIMHLKHQRYRGHRRDCVRMCLQLQGAVPTTSVDPYRILLNCFWVGSSQLHLPVTCKSMCIGARQQGLAIHQRTRKQGRPIHRHADIHLHRPHT